jgi:hypothetical protein
MVAEDLVNGAAACPADLLLYGRTHETRKHRVEVEHPEIPVHEAESDGADR